MLAFSKRNKFKANENTYYSKHVRSNNDPHQVSNPSYRSFQVQEKTTPGQGFDNVFKVKAVQQPLKKQVVQNVCLFQTYHVLFEYKQRSYRPL